MKKKELFKQKPKAEDYQYQPYGHIGALLNYVEKLEKSINCSQCCKIDKINENK